MGYDVHITRKENWFDDGADISVSEWESYIDSDPEMRLDSMAESEIADGEVIRMEANGLAVWIAYSKHGENGNMAWFDYRSGNVVVKNPDDEILNKMISISKYLGAKVQGDEGEIYPLEGAALAAEPPQSSQPPILLGVGALILIIGFAIWYFVKSS